MRRISLAALLLSATAACTTTAIPPVDSPMDFSAWFQVWLGGAWRTLDARHNRPRIGRILMARGRDATDVALVTSFGPNWLAKFDVIALEMKEGA